MIVHMQHAHARQHTSQHNYNKKQQRKGIARPHKHNKVVTTSNIDDNKRQNKGSTTCNTDATSKAAHRKRHGSKQATQQATQYSLQRKWKTLDTTQ